MGQTCLGLLSGASARHHLASPSTPRNRGGTCDDPEWMLMCMAVLSVPALVTHDLAMLTVGGQAL